MVEQTKQSHDTRPRLDTPSEDAQPAVIHDPLRITEQGRPGFVLYRSFELLAL